MTARHIAFAVDRDLVEEALDALAQYGVRRDPRLLERPLARAWARRNARRRTRTTRLSPGARAEIRAWLATDEELEDRIERAPERVRAAYLDALRRHSSLFARLIAVAAPHAAVAQMRERCADALEALDPERQMSEPPLPPLAVVRDANGAPVVNVHDWLHRLLSAARDPDAPMFGIGADAALNPEATDGAVEHSERASSTRGWPGIEDTCFATFPESVRWRLPSTLLPRPFGVNGGDAQVDGGDTEGRVVVGRTGGPLTWAVAGDEPPSKLVPSLRQALTALADDLALVSFVAVDSDVDTSWADLPP